MQLNVLYCFVISLNHVKNNCTKIFLKVEQNKGQINKRKFALLLA